MKEEKNSKLSKHLIKDPQSSEQFTRGVMRRLRNQPESSESFFWPNLSLQGAGLALASALLLLSINLEQEDYLDTDSVLMSELSENWGEEEALL